MLCIQLSFKVNKGILQDIRLYQKWNGASVIGSTWLVKHEFKYCPQQQSSIHICDFQNYNNMTKYYDIYIGYTDSTNHFCNSGSLICVEYIASIEAMVYLTKTQSIKYVCSKSVLCTQYLD